MIDLPPPTYAQQTELLVHCEIPRANIRIAYEDYLQSDEITISSLGAITDEKLRCLKVALHPAYILTIKDEVQQSAFSKLSRLIDRPDEIAGALKWLRSKGFEGQVPSFDAEKGLDAFAHEVEDACGFKRGSAFMENGGSMLAVRRDFMPEGDFEQISDAIGCLMSMFSASNAVESGISLGFIGNAARGEQDKKN